MLFLYIPLLWCLTNLNSVSIYKGNHLRACLFFLETSPEILIGYSTGSEDSTSLDQNPGTSDGEVPQVLVTQHLTSCWPENISGSSFSATIAFLPILQHPHSQDFIVLGLPSLSYESNMSETEY